MDPGEQTTGTRDEHYNLVSVLYHALHGAETIEAYILDAEAAGDERLASFFREAQAMHRQLAERAKGMLGILEVPPEPAVAPDIPPEGGVAAPPMGGAVPGAATGDVPGGTPPRTGEFPPSPSEPPPDTPGGTPPERTTGGEEAPGEQSPHAREQQAAAGRTEENQGEEEKGLVDRVKDRLTGREGNRQG